MYPNAINERWEMYTRDFNACFTLQGKSVKATFTENGEWVQSVVKLSLEQVPAAINTNFQKSPYKEYKILHVTMVSSVKELLLYEMEVEGNFKEHVRLVFNNVGEMITVKRSW